jgi:hypothetical protein
MYKRRFSISTLLWATTFVAFAFLPINRNTARQIWYTFDTKNAPKGGAFISGVRRQLPYDYGDTWFSRYNRLTMWINPGLQEGPRMVVVEPIIIPAEEEYILLNSSQRFDTPTLPSGDISP